MTKKRLLVIAGAGASIGAGFPSVRDIDDILSSHAHELMPLVDDTPGGLYEDVRSRINEGREEGDQRYFEETLYTLLELAALHMDDALLRPFVELQALPLIKDASGERLPRSGDLQFLVNKLSDSVVDVFRDKSRAIATNEPGILPKLRQLFECLAEAFYINCVSLNYDNLLHLTLPELHTGFDTDSGCFQPQTLVDSDQGLLLHLHGSVHFDMRNADGDLHAIVWQEDIHAPFDHGATGRNTQLSREGIAYPTSSIVLGLGKTFQILRNPYRTYFATLPNLVNRADAVLILGYGFMDGHLNRVLETVTDKEDTSVVVIDWKADDDDPICFSATPWANALTNTLGVSAAHFARQGHTAPESVAELRSELAFDVSHDDGEPQVAVWYFGLEEACDNRDLILGQLNNPSV